MSTELTGLAVSVVLMSLPPALSSFSVASNALPAPGKRPDAPVREALITYGPAGPHISVPRRSQAPSNDAMAFRRSVLAASPPCTPVLALEDRPSVPIPAPFQTVTRVDRRLFALVPAPREFLTLGKQSVVATGLILWRVEDPAKYMRTVFDRVGAESRLADILFAELGGALGGAPFAAFV